MRLRTILLVVALAVASALLWSTREPPTPADTAIAPAAEPAAPRKKKRAAPEKSGLVRPEPKPCLVTVEAEGEAGMAASEGLAYSEARAALNDFAFELVSCIGPDESPTGTLL